MPGRNGAHKRLGSGDRTDGGFGKRDIHPCSCGGLQRGLGWRGWIIQCSASVFFRRYPFFYCDRVPGNETFWFPYLDQFGNASNISFRCEWGFCL